MSRQCSKAPAQQGAAGSGDISLRSRGSHVQQALRLKVFVNLSSYTDHRKAAMNYTAAMSVDEVAVAGPLELNPDAAVWFVSEVRMALTGSFRTI